MEQKRDSFFLNKKQKKSNDKPKPQNQVNKRQDDFDKNRGVKNVDINEGATEKKPFDKKTYRLKKYSKKYKLEQWEEQRKKRLIRDYQKEIKNDNVSGTYKPISFDEDTIDSSSIGKYVRHPDIIEKENLKVKKDPFKKAKEQYNKIIDAKEKKKQEIERIKAERNQKLQEYKKKKHDRYKKLSRKTKKGQPVMTGRLELLLDKIQKS